MSSKFKNTIFNTILLYLPLLLLFISVFNEFDFNYLNYQYFSFNFPFILIFSSLTALGFSLPSLIKKSKNLSTEIPFGPHLVVGCVLYVVFIDEIFKYLI